MSRVTKPIQPPLAGQPTKPGGLSPQASIEWDRLAGELAEAGILITFAHRAAMTLAATIAADIRNAWVQVQKDGEYIMTKTGLQAHPATKRADALRRDYFKALTLLGLRAAVSSGEPEAETLDDFLNG